MKTNRNKAKAVFVLLASLGGYIPLSAYAAVAEYQSPDTSMGESSADCDVVYKTTYDFSEDIPKYPGLEVIASGYEGVYDGSPHGIEADCLAEGAEITYSVDGKTYRKKKPVYTDVGTYTVYYKAEKDGYTAVRGYETVRIKEAEIDYSSSDYSGMYDGRSHGIHLSAGLDGCSILYSTDGINYTKEKPEYKDAGTYVTYYKISKPNYATVEGSNKVIIGKKAISYDSSGYHGYYDGEPHGIMVNTSTDGCGILYSEDGINYSPNKPVYREPGSYLTYFKIIKEGYGTVSGRHEVIIKSNTVEYEVSGYNGTYDGKPHGITVTVGTGGCEILYSEDGINYSPNKPSYKEPGSYITYFRITKEGYGTVNGSGKVVIKTAGKDGSGDGKGDGIFSVQTGDNSHILAYLIMILASGFGLIQIKKSKGGRKKYEDK